MNNKTYTVKRKKKLGSHLSLGVIFSIILSLLILGIFGQLLLNVNRLSELIKNNIKVNIYLNKKISNNEKTQVFKTLAAKDYILKKNNIPQIEFISREEAKEQFIEDTGEDFMDFLGENPLRDVYTINIHPSYQNVTQLREIKTDLEKMYAVFEVIYSENLMKSINNNIKTISVFLLGFAIILVLIVTILINNTIKLALYSQRFLIRSMLLVGAKPSFIKKPFLSRSLFYGMLSGIIASVLLYSLIYYVQIKIPDFIELQQLNKTLVLFGLLVLVGGMIAYITTYKALKKYMKLSLDELY